MTKRGLVNKLIEELNKRDIVMSHDVAKLVVNLLLEIIIDETSKGGEVRLNGFASFKPKLRRNLKSTYWFMHIKRYKAWTRRCLIEKGQDPMDKYGYEKEKEDPTVKTAAEKDRCPQCGAQLQGSPPVCPNHGSTPFERRPDGKEEEQG